MQDALAFNLANRYATGFFHLVQKNKLNLPNLEQDLAKLNHSLNQPSVQAFLSSPILPLHAKQAVVANLAKKLQLSTELTRFVDFVLSKGRGGALTNIIVSLQQILYQTKGITTAIVSSAETLTKAEIETLNKILEKLLGPQMTTHYHTNPELIGGFVIMVGSKKIDLSLAGQITNLKKQLLTNN